MNLFKALFEERSLYFDALDNMIEAIYICDTEQNLIYFNKAAERLDGYLLSEVKGRSTYELYGLDEQHSPMLRALATERPVVNEEFSYYVNGKEIVQLCNAGPIYDEGRLVGAYTVQRDLTMFKNIVEQNIALQNAMNYQRSLGALPENDPFSNIVGISEPFQRCIEQARQAAKTVSSVMLIGATGSGKEVFARAIHDGSDRRKKPFLALNCAAIPETLIEGILFGTTKGVYTGAVEKEGILAQAEGGTVFLDEINSMPLVSQAKLLRVLEERKIMKLGSDKETPIDIRIISSTNESPTEAIRNGHMREDLFYRLSVVQVMIPPLRERKEDIPHLARFFVDKYNKRFQKNVLGIDSKVMSVFMDFSWKGNVRQLKACIESAMNFAKDGSWITLSDLPVYVFEDVESPDNRYRQWLKVKNKAISEEAYSYYDSTSGDIGVEAVSASPILSDMSHVASTPFAPQEQSHSLAEEVDVRGAIQSEEKEEIIAVLKQHKGNITKAAESLGMSRQSLSYRMKKYHLR